jgi:hypothetical protein
VELFPGGRVLDIAAVAQANLTFKEDSTMERRSFLDTIGGAVLALGTLGWSTLLTGCTVTLADVLTEIGNVLTFIAPLISGVLPIVEVADPMLAPAVIGANAVFQGGVTAVAALLDQWSAASMAAQPGILSQLQAAGQALQSDLSKLLAAAHVSDMTTAGEVTAIATTATQEIAALLAFIAELKTSGGTTTALHNAAKHYTGSLTPTADARASIVHHLRKPTGNAHLDAVRQRIAKELSKITVKRTQAGKDTFLDVPV